MPAVIDLCQQYTVCVASNAEFKQALDIRVRVFVGIQKFPLEEEADILDNTATHLVILDSQREPAAQVIGTLRILNTVEDPAAKFGRVVISPEYQGRGLGRFLMQEAERFVSESSLYTHCKYTKLGSQWDKRGFYERCGYEAKGDIYDDTGCPHIWMYKPI
ncbi:hypothetical protein EV174_004760, partial [Coemansia sp. RSA 2320]